MQTLMLVELVQKELQPVIPQLDDAVVQRGKHPRARRVERNRLYPVTLGLELSFHFSYLTIFLFLTRKKNVFFLIWHEFSQDISNVQKLILNPFTIEFCPR